METMISLLLIISILVRSQATKNLSVARLGYNVTPFYSIFPSKHVTAWTWLKRLKAGRPTGQNAFIKLQGGIEP